jgi:hypothetical protein
MNTLAVAPSVEPIVIAPAVFAPESAAGVDRPLRAARPDRVPANETHPIEVAAYVRSWRASLGNDYADWAKSLPGGEG